MMPYLSIDIETTGLNPANSLVIEFAAVLETGERNWTVPVDELPHWSYRIWHPTVYGEPTALAIHADYVTEHAATRGKPRDWLYRSDWVLQFRGWLQSQVGLDPDQGRIKTVTLAGKNAATFDLKFLSLEPGWSDLRFRHQVIDPAVLFWKPELDAALPDTKTCCDRAGINTTETHRALADASRTIELIRCGMRRVGR